MTDIIIRRFDGDEQQMGSDVSFASFMDAQRQFGSLKWEVRTAKEGSVQLLVGGKVKDAFSAADLASPPAKKAKRKQSNKKRSNSGPSDSGEGSKSKKKKTTNKKGGPKRGKSAYIIFSNENRARITKEAKEENPKTTPKDIMRLIAEEWRNMSEVAKEEWEEKAAIDKQRYEAEKEGVEHDEAKETAADRAFIADDDEDEGVTPQQLFIEQQLNGDDGSSNEDDGSEEESESEEEQEELEQDEGDGWIDQWYEEGANIPAVLDTFGDDWKEQLPTIAECNEEQVQEAIEGMQAQKDSEDEVGSGEAYSFVIKFANAVLQRIADQAACEQRKKKRKRKVKAKMKAKKARDKKRKKDKAREAKRAKRAKKDTTTFLEEWKEIGDLTHGLDEIMGEDWRDEISAVLDQSIEELEQGLADITADLADETGDGGEDNSALKFIRNFTAACLERKQNMEAEEKARYKPSKEERRERAKEEAREAKRAEREAEREEKRRQKEEERERLRMERERLPDGWSERTKSRKDGSGESVEFVSPTGTVYKSYKAVWRAVEKEEAKLVESKKSSGFMASFLSGKGNQSARKQRTKEEVEAEAEAAMDAALCEAADRAERQAAAEAEQKRQQQLIADALDRGDTVMVTANKGANRKGEGGVMVQVEEREADDEEEEKNRSGDDSKSSESEVGEADPLQLEQWKRDGEVVTGMGAVFGDGWKQNLEQIAGFTLDACKEAVEGMRAMLQSSEDVDTKAATGFVVKFTEHVIVEKEAQQEKERVQEKKEKEAEKETEEETEKEEESGAEKKSDSSAPTATPAKGQETEAAAVLSESEQQLEPWVQKYFLVGARIPGMSEQYANWKDELLVIADMDVATLQSAVGKMRQTVVFADVLANTKPVEYMLSFTKACLRQRGIEPDEDSEDEEGQSFVGNFLDGVANWTPPKAVESTRRGKEASSDATQGKKDAEEEDEEEEGTANAPVANKTAGAPPKAKKLVRTGLKEKALSELQKRKGKSSPRVTFATETVVETVEETRENGSGECSEASGAEESQMKGESKGGSEGESDAANATPAADSTAISADSNEVCSAGTGGETAEPPATQPDADASANAEPEETPVPDPLQETSTAQAKATESPKADKEAEQGNWVHAWYAEGEQIPGLASQFGDGWKEQLDQIATSSADECAQAIEGVAAAMANSDDGSPAKEAFAFLLRFTKHVQAGGGPAKCVTEAEGGDQAEAEDDKPKTATAVAAAIDAASTDPASPLPTMCNRSSDPSSPPPATPVPANQSQSASGARSADPAAGADAAAAGAGADAVTPAPKTASPDASQTQDNLREEPSSSPASETSKTITIELGIDMDDWAIKGQQVPRLEEAFPEWRKTLDYIALQSEYSCLLFEGDMISVCKGQQALSDACENLQTAMEANNDESKREAFLYILKFSTACLQSKLERAGTKTCDSESSSATAVCAN